MDYRYVWGTVTLQMGSYPDTKLLVATERNLPSNNVTLSAYPKCIAFFGQMIMATELPTSDAPKKQKTSLELYKQSFREYLVRIAVCSLCSIA